MTGIRFNNGIPAFCVRLFSVINPPSTIVEQFGAATVVLIYLVAIVGI